MLSTSLLPIMPNKSNYFNMHFFLKQGGGPPFVERIFSLQIHFPEMAYATQRPRHAHAFQVGIPSLMCREA